MEFYQWLLIFAPILYLLLIFLPRQKKTRLLRAAIITHKKKGGKTLDLTIFEAYIGTTCDVHMISDSVVMGEIKALTDRWIEVVSPHGTEIINAEYIEHIRVHKNKKK